jgi:DNA-binding response OmpR family regulator
MAFTELQRPQIHILVVDDDALLAQGVATWLGEAGYAVTTAVSFMGACDVVEAKAPLDVLVADLTLDRGNGLALSLFARAKRPQMKTVYMSGTPIDPGGLEAPLLTKPFELSDLERAIESVLSQG